MRPPSKAPGLERESIPQVKGFPPPPWKWRTGPDRKWKTRQEVEDEHPDRKWGRFSSGENEEP